MNLLLCELADVRVGWPVTAVQEIVRAVTITSLPDTPALVEGVIDVRGALVPVLTRHPPAAAGIYVVRPPGQHLARKVRVLTELLIECFEQVPRIVKPGT